MALRMLAIFNQSNHNQVLLSKIITERNDWAKFDAKICPFSELDPNDSQNLCFGKKPSLHIRLSMVLFY